MNALCQPPAYFFRLFSPLLSRYRPATVCDRLVQRCRTAMRLYRSPVARLSQFLLEVVAKSATNVRLRRATANPLKKGVCLSLSQSQFVPGKVWFRD